LKAGGNYGILLWQQHGLKPTKGLAKPLGRWRAFRCISDQADEIPYIGGNAP